MDLDERHREAVDRLNEEWRAGNRADAIAGLEALLTGSDQLPPDARSILQTRHREWRRTMDPNWAPPVYFPIEDFSPLQERARAHLLAGGELPEALRCSWLYLQYSSTGTIVHQLALSLLVDSAVALRAWPVAEAAAEMLLAHHKLVSAAVALPETVVSWSSPGDDQSEHPLRGLGWQFPTDAALLGLTEYPSPAWEQVLELYLAESTIRYAEVYGNVVEALAQHYTARGTQPNWSQKVREGIQSLIARYERDGEAASADRLRQSLGGS